MPDRPNMIVLFTDQQRFDTIRALGYEHMITPGLDRLAEEGTAYTHAYSHAPLCVPARHGLLTGLCPRDTGFYANRALRMDPSIPTLPSLLSAAGYHTEAIGKMHFHPPRNHHGFTAMQLMEEVPDTREEDDYLMYLKRHGYGHIRHAHGVRHLLYHQPQRSLLPDEHSGSTWVGGRCVEFLREHRDHPFFLWASWIAPHPPWNVVRAFADVYDGKPLPPPYPCGDTVPAGARHQLHYHDWNRASVEKLRRIRALYYAQISHVDREICRILDTLDALGQRENTLVLFASDHGEMLADRGMCQKMLPYDSAARIPFLVRWPGRVAAGRRSEQFVDLLDVLPSLLDAAGITYPNPERLPGASIFRDDAKRDRSMQYCGLFEGGKRWISVRDARYKYVYWYGGGVEELYDMHEDPMERTNLLRPDARRRNRKIADPLRRALLRWEGAWGPAEMIRDGDFVALAPVEFMLRRNAQFSRWPDRLPEEEKTAMNPMEREVLDVTADEPLADLRNLDLDWWVAHGGSQELVDRIREGV